MEFRILEQFFPGGKHRIDSHGYPALSQVFKADPFRRFLTIVSDPHSDQPVRMRSLDSDFIILVGSVYLLGSPVSDSSQYGIDQRTISAAIYLLGDLHGFIYTGIGRNLIQQ